MRWDLELAFSVHEFCVHDSTKYESKILNVLHLYWITHFPYHYSINKTVSQLFE